MTPANPHLIIAAGGTGGHMFPAQALSEVMLRRGWRVTLSTDARGARYTGGFSHAVEVRQVASATFARGGPLARLAAPLRILTGIARATTRMWREKPDVVVGFGGYPTIPAMAAAWLTRTPSMIHEQNGLLGRVNKLFARRVDTVACGTWPTLLPDGVHGVHTGNPVRGAVLERAGAPYMPPGDWPMSLLVFGGSQGARILADTVPEAIGRLPAALRGHLRVSQQARPEDFERVADAYRSLGVRAEVDSFFRDMPSRLSEAQLVVSRAGASSVADIAVVGRPAVLIPYAAATGNHQAANAGALVDVDAAVMIPESRLSPDTLPQAIESILTEPARADTMAQAALGAGVPDAADRLAALVEELARKGAA